MQVITFNPKNVVKKLTSSLNERTRDIVFHRFGIGDLEQKKTLEAIGQEYGITRERVRQIENFALNSIKQSPVYKSSEDAFGELKSFFAQKGKIVSENEFLNFFSPGRNLQNHIYFLLVLGDDFTRLKEDDEFCHRWTTDIEVANKVHGALRRLHKEITKDDLISEEEIISALKRHIQNTHKEEISDIEALSSWLNLSKIIAKNTLNEWGHSASPSINPRRMRDYIFLALRKQGSPMHFSEIAREISQSFGRQAHPATVHNELIKDNKFVLVGRGLYALGDWGYKNGIVRDVIKEILKSQGALAKEEIIKSVLKERYVKENTILVNLQNRNYFKRDKEGKYLSA